MAYHWLGLLPKAARLMRPPPRFASHLFKIALQYRSGLPCVRSQVAGLQCRCKTRRSGKRNVMDEYGFHLSSCPLGGWRIKRHDKVNCEVGAGMRTAGNKATWNDAEALYHALPSHRKERGSRTRVHRIPDVTAEDQHGSRIAVDCMITRAKPSGHKELEAARAGERMKFNGYEHFLQKCSVECPHDPRLQTTIVPFVLETHGAAGPEACKLMAATKHQFGHVVLPREDQSSEAIFFAAWAYRVSTALQIGTAEMIHNIALGNTTKSRRTGDIEIEMAEGGEGSGTGPGRGASGRMQEASWSDEEVEDSDEADTEAGSRFLK